MIQKLYWCSSSPNSPFLVLWQQLPCTTFDCWSIPQEKDVEEKVQKVQYNAQSVELKGGMTENKNQLKRDVEGQLLGGMEKMAGDLAFLQLQGVDPEQKRFNHIMI